MPQILEERTNYHARRREESNSKRNIDTPYNHLYGAFDVILMSPPDRMHQCRFD